MGRILCVVVRLSIFMILRVMYMYNVGEKVEKDLIKRKNMGEDRRKGWLEVFIGMVKEKNVDVLGDWYEELYEWMICLGGGKEWRLMEYGGEL